MTQSPQGLFVPAVGIERQGDEGQRVFCLGDPAIHCENDILRFTKTNLGNHGIDMFFKSHKCSSVCRALRLQIPLGK